MATFCPSTNPFAPSPWWKAATMFAKGADGVLRRNPIVGIVGCCARAASGMAPMLPASLTMNSRRSTAGSLSTDGNGIHQVRVPHLLAPLLRSRRDFVEKRQDRLLRHYAMACMRNHAQLRTGDRPEHLDSMLRRDDVAVADDDEGWRFDALHLLTREVWFHGPHALQASEYDGPVVCAVR